MDGWCLLLATDGSEGSWRAARFLRVLPIPSGSSLHVLTVAPGPTALGEHPLRTAMDQAGPETWLELHHVLREFETVTAREGLTVHTLTRAGDPTERIVATADELDADLVIVGSNGRSGLETLLLGSVTQGVVRRCSRPVLVARNPGDRLREVVVATDGSDTSARATALAMLFPLPPDCKITVVHIYPPFQPLNKHLGAGLREAAAEENRSREVEARRVAVEAKQALEVSYRGVATDIRAGDPVPKLLQVVKERSVDLVIAGMRGKSLLEGLFVGSVADALLKQAPCSVLVVP